VVEHNKFLVDAMAGKNLVLFCRLPVPSPPAIFMRPGHRAAGAG
jgi:hypothetical protein